MFFPVFPASPSYYYHPRKPTRSEIKQLAFVYSREFSRMSGGRVLTSDEDVMCWLRSERILNREKTELNNLLSPFIPDTIRQKAYSLLALQKSNYYLC